MENTSINFFGLRIETKTVIETAAKAIGVSVENWEAHMPETYRDLASLAYQKTLSNS